MNEELKKTIFLTLTEYEVDSHTIECIMQSIELKLMAIRLKRKVKESREYAEACRSEYGI